jgi:hypothetical protein
MISRRVFHPSSFANHLLITSQIGLTVPLVVELAQAKNFESLSFYQYFSVTFVSRVGEGQL